MREPPVAVGEVDRHVLVTDIDAELGLISCVWSRIGQMAGHFTPRRRGTRCLLIPVTGVDDAEGRVREQVGEKVERNERDGTPKRDMTEDEMILRKHTESSSP